MIYNEKVRSTDGWMLFKHSSFFSQQILLDIAYCENNFSYNTGIAGRRGVQSRI
jgi:hypothetical protein